MRRLLIILLCLILTGCAGKANQPISKMEYTLPFPDYVTDSYGECFALMPKEDSYLFFHNAWNESEPVCLIYGTQSDGRAALVSRISDFHAQMVSQLSNGSYLLQGARSTREDGVQYLLPTETVLLCLDSAFIPCWETSLPSTFVRSFITEDWIIAQSFVTGEGVEAEQARSIKISLAGEIQDLSAKVKMELIMSLTVIEGAEQFLGVFSSMTHEMTTDRKVYVRQVNQNFETQWEIPIPLRVDESVEAIICREDQFVILTDRRMLELKDAQIISTQDMVDAYPYDANECHWLPIHDTGYTDMPSNFYRQVFENKNGNDFGGFFATWQDGKLQTYPVDPIKNLVYSDVSNDGIMCLISGFGGTFTVYKYDSQDP